MADEITLTIPNGREFHRVARLVLGGLGARLDLTVETLEDLEFALEALLDRAGADAEVTVRLRPRETEIEASVGPLTRKVLDDLERDDSTGLGVRRVLESTVDDVHVDGDWVRLTKQVARA